jgi:hypothetical protein
MKRKAVKVVRRGSVEVPIYQEKFSGGTRYLIEYYDGPGNRQRVRRSTLADAREEGERIANGLSSGAAHALKLTGIERDAYVAATGKLKSTGLSLVEAVSQFVSAIDLLPEGATLREAAQALQDARRAVREPLTINEAAEIFVQAKESAGRSKEHVKKLKSRLKQLGEAFKMPVHHITGEMLIAYFDSLDLQPRTVSNHISDVGTFLRWCVRRKHAHEGILKELSAVERPDVAEPEIEMFTPAEMREMLFACRPELLPQLVICAYAGLRKSESTRLDWSQVKLDRGFVELKAAGTKNRQRRLPPLTGHT